MKTKRETTKKEIIVEALRHAILSGGFGAGKLPSKLDLAAHYGVSHRTIEPVLKQLHEEGLIRSVRGTGTFVNGSVGNVTNLTSRMVLMLMPRCSILEEEPLTALRQEAFSRGLLPVNLPMPGKYIKLTLQEKSILTQTLSAPIRGVLYNGSGYRVEPFLDNWKNLRSVGLIDFTGVNDPPGSTLLIDFETGAEKIARHFIANGCRKLLVLTGYVDASFPDSEEYWNNLISRKFFRGAAKAAADAGLPPPLLHYARTSTPPEGLATQSIGLEEAGELLKVCDGIITTYDNLAYCMIRHAETLGLKVPEDLLVSACTDTGWCSRLDRQITSLASMPQEISRRAFEILEAGGIHHEKIVPDLIIRKSSSR